MDNIVVHVILMINGPADYILLSWAVGKNFLWFFSDLRLTTTIQFFCIFVMTSICYIVYFCLIVIEYISIDIVLLTLFVGSVAFLIFDDLWGENMLFGLIHFQQFCIEMSRIIDLLFFIDLLLTLNIIVEGKWVIIDYLLQFFTVFNVLFLFLSL